MNTIKSGINNGETFHTIIHVGAHYGQELKTYLEISPVQLVLVEADPLTYQNLLRNVYSTVQSNQNFPICLNLLIGDRDGEITSFYRFNNRGESSSIYKGTPLLREKFKGLEETGEIIKLVSHRLETSIKNLNLQIESNSILVIDTQGSELKVLNGCGSYIRKFARIELEVSTESIYEGAPLLPEIDTYMEKNNFKRVTDAPWHGDVVYIRQQEANTITLSDEQVKQVNQAISERNYLLEARNTYMEFLRLGGWSHAQYAQDLFVLSMLKFKKRGYFVEFGATNGYHLSNTYLLEKEFEWTGIVAEPSQYWHTELRRNRNCSVDTRCVWSETGIELTFAEAEDKVLSSIAEFRDADLHAAARKSTNDYPVESISLEHLLDQHSSPLFIDYLSIDTEGSEFEILRTFPFNKYKVGIITVEHNWTALRIDIQQLLNKNGFKRVYETVSQCDDWYVNEENLNQLLPKIS
jgi:FkbM family methyltransferase